MSGKALLQPGVTCSGILRGDSFPSISHRHEFPLALLHGEVKVLLCSQIAIVYFCEIARQWLLF